MAEITMEEIEKVLDEKVRPSLVADQGNIEVTGFEDGVLSVRFLGECLTCPASGLTMDNVVKTQLLTALPDLKDVVIDESIPDDMMEFVRKVMEHKI